jgi:hypothetical protein
MMIRKLYVAFASLLALLAVSTAQADIARAILTTGIVEREPVNELNAIPADAQRAIFFTEIRDMAGKTVTHVWKHNGEVMADVKFNVGGPRWRVWSSKNMMPEWAGDWSVTVTDGEGNQLAEKTFTYEATAMTDEGMDKEAAPAEAAPAEAGGDAMPAEEAAPAAPMESEKPAEAPATEPMKEGE